MKEVNGVLRAIVVDNIDPDGIGRVKVRLPKVGAPAGREREAWAPIATLMAGSHRGTWFIPEVNDEVLLAFEGGDLTHPYVVGALWSQGNPPPETMEPSNNKKVIRSRSGLKITLDDQNDVESFLIETPGGQRITLKDSPGKVEISDSNGNAVKLGAQGITLTAAAKVTIDASMVEINSGLVSVNASMAKFSGAVQCDSLISNSVVSASYSPGAGNIW